MKATFASLGVLAALVVAIMPMPLASAYYEAAPLVIENDTRRSCISTVDEATGVGLVCGHAKLAGTIDSCYWANAARQEDWTCDATLTLTLALDPALAGYAQVDYLYTSGCFMDIEHPLDPESDCQAPPPVTGPYTARMLENTPGQQVPLSGVISVWFANGGFPTQAAWTPILVFPPPVYCPTGGSTASVSLSLVEGVSVSADIRAAGVSVEESTPSAASTSPYPSLAQLVDELLNKQDVKATVYTPETC